MGGECTISINQTDKLIWIYVPAGAGLSALATKKNWKLIAKNVKVFAVPLQLSGQNGYSLVQINISLTEAKICGPGSRPAARSVRKKIGLAELGTIEDIEYRGYILQVRAFGAGWKVNILPPSGKLVLPDAPHSQDPAARQGVRDEAMRIVDAHCAMISSLKNP